ncbi:mitochondrial DNA primase [Strigomonas culicis]|uniref:Mitochondrial DNA primase n=1 Tax=Strigomonas culicis TaxID=28005 RepID=S9WB60_9TRYP|nr:mitochondrial DNA primase [Strigomonas culicis]|eukprot:EPY36341.1 mitochondrial DNA primase [Strigomonas culicis]
MDEVLSLCGPGDALFARRLPAGGCQFFAWPGTSLQVASRAITSMPDTIRTVHAVFGRVNTPMDIVLDIDCAVPQEHWTMSKVRPFQMQVLDDTLSVLKEEIAKAGEKIESQVVLQSPNLKKASFHVHTKLKDAAFADYNSVHGFLARFSDRIPYADLQIYRPNGMLRMHTCMKENRTSAIVVFDDPKWQIGFPGGRVPEEAAALHSVCVREPGSFTRLLRYEPPRVTNQYTPRAADGGAAADGEVKYVTVPLPRTEREAVATASRWLRMATEEEVGEWRSWIALGLAAFRVAHHFKDTKGLPRPAMEELLDAWGTASRACAIKFKHGDCEARWATFDINRMRNATDSDWWQAYKRIGHLEKAKEEILAEEASIKAKYRKKLEAQRQTRESN